MNTPALEVSCPTCGAGKGGRCYGSSEFTHTDRHRKHIAYTLHPSNRRRQHEEALKLTQSSSFHQSDLPIHRTEAGYPNCPTCDGGGCPDCTDPA